MFSFWTPRVFRNLFVSHLFFPTLVGVTWFSGSNLSLDGNFLTVLKAGGLQHQEGEQTSVKACIIIHVPRYLEAQQDAHVPRRPVVEGVHQIFVHVLLHALVLQIPDAHSQVWLVATVLFLGIKHRDDILCVGRCGWVWMCVVFTRGQLSIPKHFVSLVFEKPWISSFPAISCVPCVEGSCDSEITHDRFYTAQKLH